MARNSKLPRYYEFNTFDNCFGRNQQHSYTWQDFFSFDSNSKLTLELGCGKAEVLLALAQQNPDEFFIGVDKKADRLWRASKNAQELKLKNIAFLQADILKLEQYFDDGIVDLIWITFPDPFPKDRQAKHRMINPNFIEIYSKILKPGGKFRIKTDDKTMFTESKRNLKKFNITDETQNLYGDELRQDAKTPTTFENKWRAVGKTIYYLEAEYAPTNPSRQHS